MREQFGFVRFDVLIQGNEMVYPGWHAQVGQAKKMVPGSGVMVRQFVTKLPASITLRLQLDSHKDYMALQAMLGTTSMLVLRSKYTNARGVTEFHDGEEWEYLKNTTLDSFASAPYYEIDGGVEVSAVFERAFDTGSGRAE